MDRSVGMYVIIAVCVVVLMIVTTGRKNQWIINWIMRAAVGSVGIYLFNVILEMQHISVNLGINLFTVLTTGFLGFPGFLVLYGIQFFKMM